jgi:RNA polymerase sigma-70 factor (ECF subfamily)
MNAEERQRQWVLGALDEFEPRLVRYATRLLGDEHTGRDIVQFAFLRLCQTTQQDVGDRLAPWLYTVCRNRALDLLRQSGREQELDDSGDECDRTRRRVARTGDLDPSAQLEQRELQDCVRQAVDELPAAQREVLLLYSEGFPYREIAAITSRSEGAVRVVVHRAIVRLREHPLIRTQFDDESNPRPGNASTSVPQRIPSN